MNKLRLLALTTVFIVASASDATGDAGVDLKTIMQNLQSDAASIVEGLLVEDFEAVDSAAMRISSHPKIPPRQVSLVAAELGSEMPNFKRWDMLVHDLALSISAAARRGDAPAVADGYKSMLDGCLACHDSYRQRVSKALEGE